MHEETTANAGADAGALVALGNALLLQGRLADALDRYRAALAVQPDRFEANANLGTGLLALHRFAEAEVHLRRALTSRPEQQPLLLALARACSAQGRLAEADEAYRRVLAQAPSAVEALVERGGVLRRLQRFEEAAAHYRQVLAMQPGNALAHYGLGHCLREQGHAADAAASFERAIEADPAYVDAHYRLAVLRPGVADAERRASLESLAPRVSAMPAAQRVRFWFALGRLREDDADFDAAFDAYVEGNRQQRQRLGPAGCTPAREAVDARLVERIRASFSRDLLQGETRVAVQDSRVPIFIVGMPRSGTSLLEQMLAAHPAVHGGGELPYLPAMLEEAFQLEECVAGAYPEVAPSLSAAALRKIGQAYLDRAWGQAAGASHVTDKLTGNFLHAGMIHLMLPQARIIHLERDPRDTCFSCYANLFKLGNIAYSYDLGTLGRQYVRCRDLMRHWHAILPATAITQVRYEALVGNSEQELRRLLDFVGLPWDARCLEFHHQRRAVHTVSVGQVGRPVYATSVARWQHFESQIKPLLDILHAGS